jgi:hypothetical protein
MPARGSNDGLVSIGGNYYSVPDRTRRIFEVQQLPDVIRILDLGNIVAEHPVLEGRKQYRIDRSHRTGGSSKRKMDMAGAVTIGRIGDHVPLRRSPSTRRSRAARQREDAMTPATASSRVDKSATAWSA